jgi:hypothetical protein
MLFLYILTIDSAMAGMALGVLLPLIFPGVCFGTLLAVLSVTVSSLWNPYLFPIIGTVLASIFAIVSSRYVFQCLRIQVKFQNLALSYRIIISKLYTLLASQLIASTPR